jgi:predicted transcriptional regulator
MPEKSRGYRAPRKERREKVHAFRLKVRIVHACHLREVSVREIAEQEGRLAATVQYYFAILEKEGWIERGRMEFDRGGRRQLYKAKRLAITSDMEFEQMTDKERYETTEGVLMTLEELCREAIHEKALVTRPDSQIGRWVLGLDRRGWEELQSDADRLVVERILEIKIESELRCRKTGEQPTPSLFLMGVFRAPASVAALPAQEIDVCRRVSQSRLMGWLEVCQAAHQTGRLDADPDSHLSHTSMALDREGWRDVRIELERMTARAREIALRSEERLRKSNEEVIPTVFSLAHFQGPTSIISGSKVTR